MKNIKKILKISLMFIIIPAMCLLSACNSNLSAYEIALKNGFVGSETEWLESLKGESAYEIAVKNGFMGTEEEWLESIKMESAYEIAVKNGFVGSEAEWLESLQGKNGKDGKDATIVDTLAIYNEAVENGIFSSETYSYLDFLKDYFENSNDYTSAVASKNLMSVVSIFSYVSSSSYTSSLSGSGVIFSIDRDAGTAYIITNYHITYRNAISMYSHYKLYLPYQDKEITATFVGGTRKYDISVLKVDDISVLLESNAQTVEFRDSGVKLGETCYAVGDTNGSGISLTKGIISVENEKIKMTVGEKKDFYREIRHDSYISHGNSGGGLFDSNGKLIGITNGGMQGTNMNYAIPADIAKSVALNIIENCNGTDKTHPKVIEMGIEYNLVAENTISVYNSETLSIDISETVKIEKIEKDSMISEDGVLKVGDVITSIVYNGREIENLRYFTLQTLLLNSKAGDEITINANREVPIENSEEGENETEIISFTTTLTFSAIYYIEI